MAIQTYNIIVNLLTFSLWLMSHYWNDEILTQAIDLKLLLSTNYVFYDWCLKIEK